MRGLKVSSPAFLAFVVLWLVQMAVNGFAGTTGKIAGTVVDRDSGKPLPGANVIIEGTTMGAATNIDGYYYILNIPPGVYSIKVSMIGYKALVKQRVRVSIDLTTKVDFKLEVSVIPGETVLVTAERPMVERDQTSKLTIVDAKVFSEIPVREFEEVVSAQVGITTDREGQLHMRGGRSGEVTYMIDGVSVQDPYYKSGFIRGGTYDGGSGIVLDKYTIQEMQVVSGGFNAEYGQAMSGIINIVTKEGSQKFKGRFEYESPMLNESPYRQRDWVLNAGIVDIKSWEDTLKYRDSVRWYRASAEGDTFATAPTVYDSLGVSQYEVPEFRRIPRVGKLPTLFKGPLLGYFSANFSGPLPIVSNLNFFIAGRYSNIDSYLPFGYDARREINTKLTYRISDIKLNFVFQSSRHYYKTYSHSWKYNPQGWEDRRSFIDRYGLELTHSLGPSTFYQLRIYNFERTFERFNPQRTRPEFVEVEEGVWDLIYTRDDSVNNRVWVEDVTNADGFRLRGDRGRYAYNVTTTYIAKFDLTSQLTSNHQIKTGLEYRYQEIFRDRWRYPWAGASHYYEHFKKYPVVAAAYIQDKMEYQRFVLNAGLRLDYSDPRHSMWKDIYSPGWWDYEKDQWVYAPEYPVDPEIHLSPRIGVAYPVTDKTVFHSSYGHFYQIPSYYEMYKHHWVKRGAPLIGNPKIKSEKTVAYEFGISQQLGADFVFDVNAYFKDITNLAASTFKVVFPYDFTVFDNSDYASVRGIDLSLEKKYGNYISGILNYTYSVAKGNESSSRDGYDYYRGADVTLRPNRQYFLAYDRTHDFSLNLIMRLPGDSGPSIFGFRPLADLRFNTLIEVASGLPYTPYIGEEAENIYVERNSARKPWISTVDLRAQKEFNMPAGVKLAGFVIVKNLFDRRNVRYVWSRTGKPWDAGPYTSHTQDYQKDPNNVGPPRQISMGLRLFF